MSTLAQDPELQRSNHLGQVVRVHSSWTDDNQSGATAFVRARAQAVGGKTRSKSSGGRPDHNAPSTGGPSSWVRGAARVVSEESVSAIRTRAELARRLSAITSDAAAKAGLIEIATLLDADADTLERSLLRASRKDPRDE